MKYLKVFCDFTLDMESLSFEERGRLFTAMLMYAADCSALLALPGNERYVWGTARKMIDAQRKSYESKCESADHAREHRNQKFISEINMKSEEEQEQEQEKEQEQNKRKEKKPATGGRRVRKISFPEHDTPSEKDLKQAGFYLNLEKEAT